MTPDRIVETGWLTTRRVVSWVKNIKISTERWESYCKP